MTDSIVYICAHARSGSTLLDQLLGAHPDICSVGEVLHLNAYARSDRSQYDPVHELKCTCGLPVPQCEFWKNVAEHAGNPLHAFQLNPQKIAKDRAGELTFRLNKLVARKIESHAQWYKYWPCRILSGGQRLGRESFQVFDAIASASGSDIILDSSKSVFRFLSLHGEQPQRMKLILLARDYRGVAFSRMQRGHAMQPSVAGWSQKLRQMENAARQVAEEQVIRVRYENLCENPEATMREVCSFIGVAFVSEVLSRNLAGMHHIGGSPSKFNEEKKAIVLDTRYQRAFTQQQLAEMRRLVGSEAEAWGY